LNSKLLFSFDRNSCSDLKKKEKNFPWMNEGTKRMSQLNGLSGSILFLDQLIDFRLVFLCSWFEIEMKKLVKVRNFGIIMGHGTE